MPKLADLVAQSSLDAFKDYAVDVAIEMEQTDVDEKAASRYSFYQLSNNNPRLSESLLRAVYTEMWKHARPASGLPMGFTHIVEYDHSLTPVLRKMMGDVMNKNSVQYSAEAMRRALARHRIALQRGRGLAPMMIRWWPVSESLNLDRLSSYDIKESWDQEKRRVEEEKKAEKTIEVKFDISIIEPPEPTPEGMVLWAKKMIQTYKGLGERHKRLLERTAELEAELEGLRGLKDRAAFGDAAKAIEEMLKNGGGE